MWGRPDHHRVVRFSLVGIVFLSFTFFVWVRGDPPVGVKVTIALTLTLPVRSSLSLDLPFALISSFTAPVLTALGTRWPASCSVPGPGSTTVSRKVPLRLFRTTFPNLNRLEGWVAPWLEGAPTTAGGRGVTVPLKLNGTSGPTALPTHGFRDPQSVQPGV